MYAEVTLMPNQSAHYIAIWNRSDYCNGGDCSGGSIDCCVTND